jgi:hypothetical protein
MLQIRPFVLRELEPSEGVEPPSSTYEVDALPLSYVGMHVDYIECRFAELGGPDRCAALFLFCDNGQFGRAPVL